MVTEATEAAKCVAGNSNGALEILRLLIQIVAVGLGAFLALLANRYLDHQKAQRDYATLLSTSVRDDVREAVETAAEYWSGVKSPERKAVLEVRIRMLQAEILQGARLLDAYSSQEAAAHLDALVRDFTSSLTGSTFEQVKVGENKQQAVVVTSKGSKLRRALADTRRLQLQRGHSASSNGPRQKV